MAETLIRRNDLDTSELPEDPYIFNKGVAEFAYEEVRREVRQRLSYTPEEALRMGGRIVAYEMMQVYAQLDANTSQIDLVRLRRERRDLEAIYADMVVRGDYASAIDHLKLKLGVSIDDGARRLIGIMPETGARFERLNNSYEEPKYILGYTEKMRKLGKLNRPFGHPLESC
ncbi:MAG TPA: hypothetical protein VG917_01795 [Patescibacteria group bacterium]|nr:hypothetical protein [Patescibacteria group bacterium]